MDRTRGYRTIMTVHEPGLADFLFEQGLAAHGEKGQWTPLSGGVSSDIWRVETSCGAFCVKRALAKLKVAADWEAPVERNAFEWAYMQVASAITPECVPRPIAHDPERGLFAMAWLAPEQHMLWKAELLAGHIDPVFAGRLGNLVGQIHAATANDPSIPARFATDTNFHALRIEPYLLATAAQHLDLAERIREIAATTASTKRALVHGDVSPKNILVGPDGPVLLDAEVAWFGDPAFDIAFCVHHLAIKARIVPDCRQSIRKVYEAFITFYRARIDWENAKGLEARAARLLPALALARVDGKSPVEYLDHAQQDSLRAAARAAILAGAGTLDAAWDLLAGGR